MGQRQPETPIHHEVGIPKKADNGCVNARPFAGFLTDYTGGGDRSSLWETAKQVVQI